VAERALRLGDEEGVEAVTIRRLAQELGVTPMALYWHFKNKEELISGVVDHAFAQVRADRTDDQPWAEQLRAMVTSLVTVMRRHPSVPALMRSVDKTLGQSFSLATEDALRLLTTAGFDVEQAYWVATYALNAAIGLVQGNPVCPVTVGPDEVKEWRRQKRLAMESLPADRFPMVVEFAHTYTRAPDTEHYYSFGIDLLMSGVTTVAAQLQRQTTTAGRSVEA
jgi:TetR/AcrR family transcriptional regulator, tetracycline repressor protein